MKKADLVTGILLLVFSLGYGWQAVKLPQRHFEDVVESNVYPTGVAVVLSLLSVALIISSLLRASSVKNVNWVPPQRVISQIVFVFFALIAYIVLFQTLGYLVRTILFMFALIKFMDRKRSLLSTGVLSVLVAVISYVLFVVLFQTPMPHGILI